MNLACRLVALERLRRCQPPVDSEFTRAERRHFERIKADPELNAICAERHALHLALGIDPDDLRASLDAMRHPELWRLALAYRRRDRALRAEAPR